MKILTRLPLATITAITLLTGIGGIANADGIASADGIAIADADGIASVSADAQHGHVSVFNQYIDPQPDLVIDKKNIKDFEKSGLHLFPGQIVEIKVDHHLNYPQTGVHPSLDQIPSGKRSLYRSREFGAAGTLTVESGAVIPFYGLWMLSAIGHDHAVSAVVDQRAPSQTEKVSLR